MLKESTKEPRVTVVIVNWNYGRYVGQAIKSVIDQTYENWDCLILDNGSEDDSADIIADAVRGLPRFTFYALPKNLGHVGAAVWAFKYFGGDFVTFLDADDFLFPDFLASHLQVHIAAEKPTGFTSSSCLVVNDKGEASMTGNWWMMRSWNEGESTLRAADNVFRLAACDEAAYAALAERTRYIPFWRPGWNWCPGSSNVYRTGLLERLRPKVGREAIFGGVDGFFTPILHAITGTNLIDRLLNAYRIHGANDFSRLPGFVGVRSSFGDAEARADDIHRLTLLSLVDGVGDLVKVAPADRFWQILDTVASINRGRSVLGESEMKATFARRYSELASISGERSLIDELMKRLKPRDCADIVRFARKGAGSMPARRRIAKLRLRNTLRSLRRKIRTSR